MPCAMEISYLRYTFGHCISVPGIPLRSIKSWLAGGRKPRFCVPDGEWALCRSRALRLRGVELQLPGTALPRGRYATKVTASQCRVCACSHIDVGFACGPRHQTHQSVNSFDADDGRGSTRQARCSCEVLCMDKKHLKRLVNRRSRVNSLQ